MLVKSSEPLRAIFDLQIVPYDGMKITPRKSYEGQARAKYNFLAQTHLELSLAKGELVVLTRRVDDNWFEGRVGGRKGIFPVSYVEVNITASVPSIQFLHFCKRLDLNKSRRCSSDNAHNLPFVIIFSI